MFAGGIILSLTMMGFAVWLQHNEQLGWPSESYDGETDEQYLKKRRRHRFVVNALFFLGGVLVLVATFAGIDRKAIWLGCWMLVTLFLLLAIILAGFDVLRTRLYIARKLPEIRKKKLMDDE